VWSEYHEAGPYFAETCGASPLHRLRQRGERKKKKRIANKVKKERKRRGEGSDEKMKKKPDALFFRLLRRIILGVGFFSCNVDEVGPWSGGC